MVGPVDNYFASLIDEVQIFNRALTAEKIAAIYNAGSSGKCDIEQYILTVTKTGTGSASGCSGTGNCSFNITANSGVIATFNLTYSISGTVRSRPLGAGPGTPISGVTMTLSGTSGGTTTTDVNGNYTFTGLTNGNYTVTPSRTGYTFTPTSRAVTINNANVTGQNFTRN